jgi:uncharacterized protein with GYD domain
MTYFLIQATPTAEMWAALVKNPQDRTPAIEKAIRALGGRVERLWFCLGEYEMVGIAEVPDNLSMAACLMAVSAGGSCKAVKTTPLLTMQEGIEAMKKAAALPYKPITASNAG